MDDVSASSTKNVDWPAEQGSSHHGEGRQAGAWGSGKGDEDYTVATSPPPPIDTHAHTHTHTHNPKHKP